jgi:hypothetical protein
VSDLLARAGELFLAPAPAAPHVVAPPPDLVAVLAAEEHLGAVAGGVAAALRRRHGARAALVLLHGDPGAGALPVRAAAALARALDARGIPATARGRLCRAALPADPEEAPRTAWQALAVAAGLPAVLALPRRTEALDPLLADADLLLLAAPPGAAPPYLELALRSLAAIGPAARVTVPDSVVARRFAAAGWLRLDWDLAAAPA